VNGLERGTRQRELFSGDQQIKKATGRSKKEKKRGGGSGLVGFHPEPVTSRTKIRKNGWNSVEPRGQSGNSKIKKNGRKKNTKKKSLISEKAPTVKKKIKKKRVF